MTTINALIRLYGEFVNGGDDEDIKVLVHMLTDDKDLKEVTPDGVGDTLFAIKELNIWKSSLDTGAIVYDLCENGGVEFKDYLIRWRERNEDFKDEVGDILLFLSKLSIFMENKYKRLSLAYFFVGLYSTLYDGSESTAVKTALRNFTSYERVLDRDGEGVDRILENDTACDPNIVRKIKNDIFISEHNLEMSDFYCAVKELFNNGLISGFKMDHSINLMKSIIAVRKNGLELRELGITCSTEVTNKEQEVVVTESEENDDTSLEEHSTASDDVEVEVHKLEAASTDELEEENVPTEPVELEQDGFNLFDLSTPADLD